LAITSICWSYCLLLDVINVLLLTFFFQFIHVFFSALSLFLSFVCSTQIKNNQRIDRVEGKQLELELREMEMAFRKANSSNPNKKLIQQPTLTFGKQGTQQQQHQQQHNDKDDNK